MKTVEMCRFCNRSPDFSQEGRSSVLHHTCNFAGDEPYIMRMSAISQSDLIKFWNHGYGVNQTDIDAEGAIIDSLFFLPESLSSEKRRRHAEWLKLRGRTCPRAEAGKITAKEIGLKMKKNKEPPIHPGEILAKEFLEPMGISPSKLARELGVTRALISEIVRGKRRITANTAVRLATYFKNSPEFWLGLQTTYDVRVKERTLM